MTSSELAQDLGRGWRLFRELMPQLDPGFEALFQSSTGLSTEDYFICWSALLTNYAKPNAEATIFSADTSAPKTDCPEVFAQFLKLESQSPAGLRAALWPGLARHAASSGTTPPYDYRPLRERPILRSADGRMKSSARLLNNTQGRFSNGHFRLRPVWSALWRATSGVAALRASSLKSMRS